MAPPAPSADPARYFAASRSNSRRFASPVNASCRAWNSTSRAMRRCTVTSLKAST